MAVYRLGDMIRMRRKALGMTQGELIQIYDGKETEEKQTQYVSGSQLPYRGRSHDMRSKASREDRNEICSVQVLRRIENGGVARVKIDVFRRLMLKMGVLPERIYASLLVTECRALRLKSEIYVHICQQEYDKAEAKLQELETKLIPDYPRNRQYLMALRANLAYNKGEMEAKEYLETLLNALRYTVPKLDEIDIAEWPFNMNEFDILLDIANVYRSMREIEKGTEFLLKLKKNVEKKYMDGAYYVAWHMCTLVGLSQFMCITNQHDKSLGYCRTGIEECRKQRILGKVFRFLFDIAWGRENQIRIGIYPKEGFSEQQEEAIKKELAFCKQQLVQAYYLSIAQGEVHEAERIQRLYNRYYPNAIRLL